MSQVTPITQERPPPEITLEAQQHQTAESLQGDSMFCVRDLNLSMYSLAIDEPVTQEFVVTLDGAQDGYQRAEGVPYSARQFPMKAKPKKRPRSPGLRWYKHYGPDSFKDGRVLVIDYIKQGTQLIENVLT